MQLNAARNEGVQEHQKYVDDVTNLCILAGMQDKALGFVKANTTVDQVRDALLKARVDEGGPEVHPQHPLAAQSKHQTAVGAWNKIADKLNARVKK